MWQYLRQTIRQLRLARHWTQRDLAERLGVCAGAVGRYENGARELPAELLSPLSAALEFDFCSLWAPPQVYLPDDNRRPWLDPYPIKGSHADFPRLGYVRPALPTIVSSEMEAAYPRDNEHELIAGYKVLGDSGQLCFTSLDALGCSLLVAAGYRDYRNSLRHMRHALVWKDIVLIPQVTIAAVVQARMPRVDWLVLAQKQWLYVELNGGQHDIELDAVRLAGLGLRELRYSNKSVLQPRFIQWLHRDIMRIVDS